MNDYYAFVRDKNCTREEVEEYAENGGKPDYVFKNFGELLKFYESGKWRVNSTSVLWDAISAGNNKFYSFASFNNKWFE